jgi:hypothetical protein
MSTPAGREGASAMASAVAVFLISAAVIGLELALMRCFSIAVWHNFSYLVISTALLGFGASGTLLSFAGPWLDRRFSVAVTVLALLFAVSVSLCFRAAQALPLEPRYVLYSRREALLMLAHHLLILVPFFLAACAIGLSLSHQGGRVHLIYAANLIGGGAGAAFALGLMYLLPAERLLHPMAALAGAAALVWAVNTRRRGLLVPALLVGALLAAGWAFLPLRLRLDAYKTLAQMRLWEEQGNATHLATLQSPRARLDVYDSPLLHQTMFADLTTRSLPPPQVAILADGDLAATVFKIGSPDAAQILDSTPMALAYRLVPAARVLLLGEGGGTDVWLARRMGAVHVTIVQPNPQIVELLRGRLAALGGAALSGPDVTVAVSDPRSFLEQSKERFDIIQLAMTEGMAAGASGLLSLHEDFLLTREGLALCIEHLTGRGMVTVTRGWQSPPRDNVKLFATLLASLDSLGAESPGTRLVQVRNWLAATTLAFAEPVGADRCRLLESAARDLNLDVESAPCAGLLNAEQIHQTEGPEGTGESWFRYADEELLAGRGEGLFRGWAYNIRPPTDDSPYFYNFFRWKSLPRFVQAYGELWMTRLELGYVVLVFALVQALVAGAVLILLPLVRLRSSRGVTGRSATCAFFALLGLGYLMLEMACIMKFTRLLGDPIYAAAGALTSFLVFSGVGSMASARLCPSPRQAVRAGALGAACLAILCLLALDPAISALAGWPLSARFAASVALAAPLAFLMGWPFPNGLTLLQRSNSALIPWAWGTNGFASVAASPLAVMIAIGWGYRSVFALSAALYALAALISPRLPGAARDDG